jgi:zinc protease
MRAAMFRILTNFATLCCCLMLVAAGAQAIDIKEVTSPGGIKAWLVESRTIPLIAMEFSFEGGSTLDAKGREGTAHFITGMMDEGADDLDGPTFQAKRDDMAMKLSFDASLDRLEGRFQTLAKNKDQAFELLRKSVTAPRFESDAMERIRRQFMVSAQDDAQDPEKIAGRTGLEAAFPGHPYSRPTNGTVETIKVITADDLRAYHKAVFTRKGLKISVVGDIDAVTLARDLDRIFGGLPDTPTPPDGTETKVAQGPMVKVIARDMPQSIVVFGQQGIKRDDPEFIPAFIMSHILGGGDFGARLTTEVREKRGLTYGIGYGLDPLRHAGLYYGSFSTRNEKAGEALEIVKSTLRKMRDEGPTQAELDDAKTFLTGSYALRFDSNVKIAGQLLGLQQAGLPVDYVNTRNARITAVTLDQAKAQAKRLIDPDKLIVIAVGKPEGITPTAP